MDSFAQISADTEDLILRIIEKIKEVEENGGSIILIKKEVLQAICPERLVSIEENIGITFFKISIFKWAYKISFLKISPEVFVIKSISSKADGTVYSVEKIHTSKIQFVS